MHPLPLSGGLLDRLDPAAHLWCRPARLPRTLLRSVDLGERLFGIGAAGDVVDADYRAGSSDTLPPLPDLHPGKHPSNYDPQWLQLCAAFCVTVFSAAN